VAKRKNNRQFILAFYKTINETVKTTDLLARFISDPKLADYLIFLEKLFPKFRLIPQEITTERDRVIVRAMLKGKHTGERAGIPATQKTINTIFAAGYEIENKKIVDHWLMIDHMELLKQLGFATRFHNTNKK